MDRICFCLIPQSSPKNIGIVEHSSTRPAGWGGFPMSRYGIVAANFKSPHGIRGMSKISVAVGADHGGYKMKEALIPVLEEMGCEVLDLGTDSLESVDYPDYAAGVAGALRDGRASMGLLICGSGIGMSIAANRHHGIRAALCNDVTSARLARQHNDANILVLGERLTGPEIAEQCLRIFFATDFEGGRHARRVKKLG